MSPSSLSSSSGPVIAMRWCRVRAEIRRAAAVIVRSGLSTRPAISHPSPTETTAMMPSAIPDSISSRSSVSLRSPAALLDQLLAGVDLLGGRRRARPAACGSELLPPVISVPLVPPPLVRSVNVVGSCWATRKYVMTSRHAPEARNRPT